MTPCTWLLNWLISHVFSLEFFGHKNILDCSLFHAYYYGFWLFFFCEGNLFLFLTSSNLSLYLILFIIWIWIGFFRTILFLFSSISSSIFVMDKVYSYIIESINHDLDYSSRLKNSIEQFSILSMVEYGIDD